MEFPDIHSPNKLFDCIVVGAGIEGLATAYRLAKKGCRTLLLEQYALPHTRGSSHGASRIIRYAHTKLHYAEMIPEVFESWKLLEKESNTKLLRTTGMLTPSRPGNPNHDTIIAILKTLKKPFEEFTPKELQKRFPEARFGELGYRAYIDSSAGLLTADKALKCFQDQFIAHGGILQDEEKVLRIVPGNIVTVVTNKGQYRAKSVAITAGPWSAKLLNSLGVFPPIKVWRVNVCFFKEKSRGTYSSYPIFLDDVGNGFAYGFPSTEGYMKIGYHYRWKEVDPDYRDQGMYAEKQKDVEFLKQYVQRVLPGLEPEPAIIESCMYTCTPSEDIIIDKHPIYSNIVYACGFSGQGFKLAPIVGKMLCELALGKPTSYDLTPFTLEALNADLAKSKL